MKIHPLIELSYCTNVHPAETFQELLDVIQYDIPQIKQALDPHEKMGSGLRISANMLDTLQDPSNCQQLIDTLQQHDVYVSTINGFPYGDFTQSARVKEKVYQPDWAQSQRCDYTIALAQLISRLPGPSTRTISTVAGGFQPHILSDLKGKAFSTQFKRLVHALIDLETQTQIRVCIALEPEPWTTLETRSQVIDFFDRWVRPSHPLATRYIGLCYDTCHQALAFENPKENWSSFQQQQIPIYKVQVSNALQVAYPFDKKTQDTLFQFIENRYLHQVSARTDADEILRHLDLPMLQASLQNPTASTQAWLNASLWRCHFHVPIWWAGDQYLQTTQSHWQEMAICVAEAVNAQELIHPIHMEIETYSWSVIPAQHQKHLGSIHKGIIQEFHELINILMQSLKCTG